ncbi:peptidyl-prolyl cis-trans isomerase [Thiomicrospira microaerophila]|uniref:peptidylprolyl isomerase n=1 Tax=Thiomicrospira microaerophila TaxID=406020 RepID=UPI00200C40EE|nr:peptidylprolyl isomerase [Thiomicrospira microaerophila]UQB43292.1 peptidyl-prolyl cis-trans isomerase [Thiomicrospira microaerophila]
MTQVTFHTTMGDIKIEVNHEQAPISAANFVQYAEDGFYNGTLFHRIIPNFVVQGGGLVEGMESKPNRDPIKNEADNGLKNLKGSLSMARTMDPNSATSQFFINLKDNDFLDHTSKDMHGWGYAVFAKIVEGMDVVEKMAKVKTTHRLGHQDVPVDDITIENTTVEKA